MKNGARAMPPPGLAAASGADDFRLEDFLPYQLAVAAARVSRLLSQCYSDTYGLTIPEWRVLATIARFATVSPTDVGEWTAMDKVKVSRAAASLVARGLIRQSPDPNDGRGRRLSMTRKGRGIYERVVPQARALEATLADGVGRSQWTALSKALARLNEHVQNVEGAREEDAMA
jgi:DNA-binding MarR family transcriptional regulator